MGIFNNPNFRNILIGNAISTVGDGFHSIAAMWWIKVQTGSDALVASVAIAKGLTSVILAPFAGALVDRHDRRRVMLLADLGRAVIISILGVLGITEGLEPWMLISSAVLIAVLDTLFSPAFSSSIPNIVDQDQLAPANSSLQIAGTLAAITGPALGGIAIAAFGSGFGFLVNAASFVISASFIFASHIPMPTRTTEATNSSLLNDVIKGWHWLRGQRLLFGIILLALGLNFLMAPLQVLFPGYAKDVLQSDARGFGLLEAGFPMGFLIGAVLLGVIKPRKLGPMVLTCMVAVGGIVVALGISKLLPVSLGLIVSLGVLLAIMNITITVVFQSRIPNEMQGRVFGVMQTLGGGLQPLGMALAPALIAALGGIPNVMIVMGVLTGLASLSFLTVPGFLEMRPPTPTTPSSVAKT
jgi:MFS transporter, DHA3 family, macrolide efflux protein